jgi:hypothetical protein
VKTNNKAPDQLRTKPVTRTFHAEKSKHRILIIKNVVGGGEKYEVY